MRKNHYPCVLTIAGTDPSGGAGIQADIKSISANGCYAASVITALVAQNTRGVQAIQDIPPDFIGQQLDSVFDDLNISAIKIGMLHNEKIIEIVASALEKVKNQNVVLDPVMIAKNGCSLIEPGVIDFLKKRLFPLVNVITPNLFEAEVLLGKTIETPSDMESASEKIAKEYKINVLIKGGHLKTPQSSDVLYVEKEAKHHWFHADRISTPNTHGTGCTLSSAIASYLARGESLKDAVSKGKQYLTKAIQSGSSLKIGHGCGPVDHFYFLEDIQP